MSGEARVGRPRASSREMLAEAACELFLEKGYAGTSVADITARAGVSRSSFFNYFASKADVLWGELDERISILRTRLRAESEGNPEGAVRAAVRALAEDFRPDPLALALAQAEAMGIADDLDREAGVRCARIAASVAERLSRGGTDPLRADARGAAYAAVVLVAIRQWAGSGAGRLPLVAVLDQALDALALTPPAVEHDSEAESLA